MFFDSPITGYGLLPELFAKTTLFSPLLRGTRVIHSNTVLPILDSQQQFRCSGPQLDETDREVLMGLILLSGKRTYGEAFSFTRYRLFQVIKQTDSLSVGKNDYDRLDMSLKRLSETKVALDVDLQRPTAMRSILHITPSEDGHLQCAFNPCLADIFNHCVAISLDERRSCRSALAKSLHILLHCSSDPNELYSLSWLVKRFGQGSPTYKVRERIERACEALVHAKVLVSYEWKEKVKKHCYLSLKRRWKSNALAIPQPSKSLSKEKLMFMQGTLVFSQPLSNAFFAATTLAQQKSIHFSTDDKRDVAILVRGSVYAPFIKDNSKIIINHHIKAVDEDLVLVRRKNTFAIGFAEFDESGKLTLKYPGHQNLEWEAGELDQIVKIQGVIS